MDGPSRGGMKRAAAVGVAGMRTPLVAFRTSLIALSKSAICVNQTSGRARPQSQRANKPGKNKRTRAPPLRGRGWLHVPLRRSPVPTRTDVAVTRTGMEGTLLANHEIGVPSLSASNELCMTRLETGLSTSWLARVGKEGGGEKRETGAGTFCVANSW